MPLISNQKQRKKGRRNETTKPEFEFFSSLQLNSKSQSNLKAQTKRNAKRKMRIRIQTIPTPTRVDSLSLMIPLHSCHFTVFSSHSHFACFFRPLSQSETVARRVVLLIFLIFRLNQRESSIGCNSALIVFVSHHSNVT